MVAGAEGEGARARPLSGGLWTLFSWLRRDEHSSAESVSSAGSDRTAASFAFFAPALYGGAAPAPAACAPPSPSSASYRRRVRERSLRRHRDRDLTLHRKYGLYALGFDAASLPAPSARPRRADERARRAASESPRAHVPGKRRAPPPPGVASLPRRRARKRPAPPPPAPLPPPPSAADLPHPEPMNPLPSLADPPPRGREEAMGCKPEKYSKKDTQPKETKDVKIRHEKSFLKQIFENKKRNSSVETASVKLLPSISELDKQAAEMIEKYRLKEMTVNDSSDREFGTGESTSKRQPETWICTRCLKKYDSSVITCNYCLPLNMNSDSYKSSKVSSSGTQTKGSRNSVTSGSSGANIEDKEKLKEILKEMKDSLPKRPKSELISSNKIKNTREIESKDYPKLVEAPTLRIGSSICIDKKPIAQASTSSGVNELSPNKGLSQNTNKINNNELSTISSVVVTQPVVLVHTKESNIVINENKTNKEGPDHSPALKNDATKSIRDNTVKIVTATERINQPTETKPVPSVSRTKYDLNTPLKISSLLNPIYVPRTTSTNTETKIVKQVEQKDAKIEKYKTASEPQPTGVEKIVNLALIPATPSAIFTPPVTTNKHEKLQISQSENKIETKEMTSQTKNKEIVIKGKSTPVPIIEKPKNISNEKNIIFCKVDAQPKHITNEKNILVSKIDEKPKSLSNDKNILVSKIDVKLKNLSNEKQILVSKIDEKSKNTPKQLTDIIDEKPRENETNVAVNSASITPSVVGPSTSNEDRVDQHARRRNLINQLERSIARGDEKAAAEAAVKLAQLKLSCSVLSFSSQIVAEPSTSSLNTPLSRVTVTQSDNVPQKDDVKKVVIDTEKQLTPAVTSKETARNVLIQTNDKRNDDKEKTVHKENLQKPQIATVNASDPTKNYSTKQTASEPKYVVANPGPSAASFSESSKKENNNGDLPILIWVEDKEATRGPIQLHVGRGAALGDLRTRAERALGLPARLQRWIVGRALCADDRAPLADLAGPDLAAPFYLCLVEADAKAVQPQTEIETKEDPGNVYNELVKLEKQPLVSNAEVFECGVCMEECVPGNGVVLRECVHSFCKECLSDVVKHSEEPVVACPGMGCRGVLQEREIRGLVSLEEYEKWLARGLAVAESGTRNAFHCRTRDCTGWALCDPGVRRFPCPVCKRTNCVLCQAIHEGETCDQHRSKLESATSADASQTDEGTRALLNSLIARGEALECPECSAIITKKWGCDWIKCSSCKTEICWVTRGRRWGPAGRGDTSAGCRCGVDGKRCHPSCGYCH